MAVSSFLQAFCLGGFSLFLVLFLFLHAEMVSVEYASEQNMLDEITVLLNGEQIRSGHCFAKHSGERVPDRIFIAGCIMDASKGIEAVLSSHC